MSLLDPSAFASALFQARSLGKPSTLFEMLREEVVRPAKIQFA
jgi:hypothetical protein